jgi:molecular chaperone GrpE
VTETHKVPPEDPAGSDPQPDAAGPEPRPGALPVEPSENAVSRLEGQLSDAQERHLRLAAEYDNFRKRVARERVELTDRAQAALVIKLLDVLDDLDRLAAQDLSVTGTDALHEALVLVDRKLRKELVGAGLERIEPVGEPFNPTEHEAVSVTAASDPALDHKVSAVFQAGYRFKGSLVRPARVQVYSTEA